jgi:hypothetical protein
VCAELGWQVRRVFEFGRGEHRVLAKCLWNSEDVCSGLRVLRVICAGLRYFVGNGLEGGARLGLPLSDDVPCLVGWCGEFHMASFSFTF